MAAGSMASLSEKSDFRRIGERDRTQNRLPEVGGIGIEKTRLHPRPTPFGPPPHTATETF